MEDDEIILWHVDVLDEIERDIESLANFYYEVGDGEKSERQFRNSITKTLKSLETFPRIHKMWDEDDIIRRVDVPTHKVAIIYRIDDDELEVIAIAAFHTLQDPVRYQELINRRIAIANERHQSRSKKA